MTPLWDGLDGAPANYVYGAVALLLIALAIIEYTQGPRP